MLFELLKLLQWHPGCNANGRSPGWLARLHPCARNAAARSACGRMRESYPRPSVLIMARGRKVNAKEADNAALQILQALRFIAPAMKKGGTVQETHCRLGMNPADNSGMVAASNSILTIGCPIPEKLNTAPHFFRLMHALEKCGNEMSMTQQDDETIVVKSGKWRAKVPCLRMNDIAVTGPQMKRIDVCDKITEALATVAKLTDDTGDRPVLKAVHLRAYVAVASNGFAAIGRLHGYDLPPALLLPPEAVKAITGAGKPLVGIGFSDTAATFHYNDGSFIKTQLYIDSYPDVFKVLIEESNTAEVPDGFFDAIRDVAPASENNFVNFIGNLVCSHDDPDLGSAMELVTMPTGADGQYFRHDMLLALKPNMQRIRFDDVARKLFFYSDDVRGVIMGGAKREVRKQPTKRPNYSAKQAEYLEKVAENNYRTAEFDPNGDDIPF